MDASEIRWLEMDRNSISLEENSNNILKRCWISEVDDSICNVEQRTWLCGIFGIKWGSLSAGVIGLSASVLESGRLRLKCGGTRAETRFRLSAKWTIPFKSAGASVHSTTGSRDVRISSSNAGYTMFWGSVKSTGYSLHSPVSSSLPLPRVLVPSRFSWILPGITFWNQRP